ncbi:unnamed protein product, partial [Amoebophrya sp. A25]
QGPRKSSNINVELRSSSSNSEAKVAAEENISKRQGRDQLLQATTSGPTKTADPRIVLNLCQLCLDPREREKTSSTPSDSHSTGLRPPHARGLTK